MRILGKILSLVRSPSLRLMVVTLLVAFTSELLSNSVLYYIPMLFIRARYYPLGLLFLVTGPILIFTATYLLYTPHDLRSEYKLLLATMFSGALLGYMIGAIIWNAIALATGLLHIAPNTTLASYYPSLLLLSLSNAVHYVFYAFTAAVISHIRRRQP